MPKFGSGMSSAASAVEATRQAIAKAMVALAGERPKLAIVFASVSYADIDDVGPTLEVELAGVPVVGGTAGGCLFAGDGLSGRAVSVVLLGGDDLEAEHGIAECNTPACLETVAAAEGIARAADAASRRGFEHYTCLVFGPGIFVDGEALVAAVRKGAGARAQLAGALTGDDFTLDRPKVFAARELRSDRVVVVGLFTRTAVGIAARHGWQPAGPSRTVTRADGVYLRELDHRPALDVWVEDARRAGARPPAEKKALALYLANHHPLGLLSGPPSPRSFRPGDDADHRELVARAPFALEGERGDGVVQLSATIAEGSSIRVMHASKNDLLRAAADAASAAVMRAARPIAGALVLPCTGRLASLGDAFAEEPARIRERIGAPIGGACVFGEIARNVRDADAFFNSTTVVIAFGA
jgi:hypothetical protein